MKTCKFLLLTSLFLVSFTLISTSQNIETAQRNRQISEKDTAFLRFLYLFAEIQPPYNNKKDFNKILHSNSIKKINENFAYKFLHLKKQNIYFTKYDMETGDSVGYKISLPEAFLKFKKGNIFVVYYSVTQYLAGCLPFDLYWKYLATFDSNGNMIDTLIVSGTIEFEKNWTDFVIISDSIVKVFFYSLNPANFDIKQGIIYGPKDKNKPFTVVEVTTYKIDKHGKFVKTGKPQTYYCKNYPGNYWEYNPKSDDPMNKY